MKKILIPTDFSKIASKAYSTAAQIARANGASIVLFHASQSHFKNLATMAYPFTDANLIETAQDEDREEKKNALAKLDELSKANVFEGLTVETRILTPDEIEVADAIVKAINVDDHSLIVIGTEGEEKESETVAQLVARHATIPVITVKEDIEALKIENITLCTDFKNISRKFTHGLKAFADKIGATITILYINTPKNFLETQDIITEFKRFKRMYDLKGTELSVYNAYKVESGILNYLNRTNSDLLALSTHGRTGLSHFFFGSYTDDIINQANVPVYTYNLHDFNEGKIHYEGSYSAYSGGFVG